MNLKSVTLFILTSFITSPSHAIEVYKTDPSIPFVSFSYQHLNYSVQTGQIVRQG